MLSWTCSRTCLWIAVCAIALLPAPSALAALLLPGGDTLLNGAFDEIEYGSTPGLAYVTPFLFVGDLAATDPPHVVGGTTNLTYGYSFDGLGTSLMTITYTLTNDDPAAFTDLRFMVDVQADGSGSFNDIALAVFGVPMAGDPVQFQIADFSENLPNQIVTNDGLDGSDTCGGAVCDVDTALQWDLATLNPGETWRVTIGLSDDGSTLSSRYLQVTSADTASTVLTFSGVAAILPEPSALVLLGIALAFMSGTRRRST